MEVISILTICLLNVRLGLCVTLETYNWKSVVTGGGGGFVPGIIFNPKEKDLLYARTDIGGAYRWNQTNNKWIPLLDSISPDEWNLYGVDSLATDPVDPSRVYIAAGTYTNSWGKTNGEILRSADYGNTWERTKLPFKVGGNMPGRSMGERLAVDPNNNKIIYFGARSGKGLWKSVNYGKIFSKVSSFTAEGKYVEKVGDSYLGDPTGIVWVVFDAKSGSTGEPSQSIYVGIADKGQSVYHSADGGQTWAAIAGQPTGYLPHHGILTTDGILFITYSNGVGPYDGTKGEVWKLNTTTGVWTDISPIKSSDVNNHFGYGGISVDFLNQKTVVLATLNNWSPDAIFFRTTDGGTTWSRIWEYNSYPNRKLKYQMDISVAPWLDFSNKKHASAPKLGWMVGSLAIDPHNSNRMLYGTGATIYGTNDLTNWDKNETIHIKVMAEGIEETSVTGLISPPNGAHLYSTMADISGFRHDDLDKSPNEMYTVTYPGTWISIDYAELNPKFMARIGYGKPHDNPPIRSSAFSYDSGINWFAGNKDPKGMGEGGGRIAAAADSSRVLWSPKTGGLFYSEDNGNSWNKSIGISQCSVASDRVNPKIFYCYTWGSFYVSKDGGVSFQKSINIDTIIDLKAAPGHEGDVWLSAGSNGLYHSIDIGSTFTKMTGVDRVDNIGFGKAKSANSYHSIYINAIIDGVRGVYRSDDKAISWVRINDDTHRYTAIQCITGDPRIYGRVYIGTNGRGILYGDP